MYHFSDESPEAQAWRVQQMHENNAIEGVEMDQEIANLVAEWDRQGIPDDEQIERLKELIRPHSPAMV